MSDLEEQFLAVPKSLAQLTEFLQAGLLPRCIMQPLLRATERGGHTAKKQPPCQLRRIVVVCREEKFGFRMTTYEKSDMWPPYSGSSSVRKKNPEKAGFRFPDAHKVASEPTNLNQVQPTTNCTAPLSVEHKTWFGKFLDCSLWGSHKITGFGLFQISLP
jgi:hypothetical protein